jgi:hypothetical protein
MRVTNVIPHGCALPLTVATLNSILTRKAVKGGKPKGVAYVQKLRQPDELRFMEECCKVYLKKEEDKNKLDVAKKEIIGRMDKRFRDLDDLAKNIEFNVNELLTMSNAKRKKEESETNA